MDSIPFAKLSGCHNDFVLIDNRDGHIPGDPAEWASNLCARRYSVGADGLLVIESDPELRVSMRYFNADGSMAELCGNGARCVALYAYREDIAPKEMKFRSPAGLHWAQVKPDSVKVSMPDPRDIELDLQLKIDSKELSGVYLNTGVPHFVLMVSELSKIPVSELGERIRYHPKFSPEGANANFVQILESNGLALRTYERGVEDETLACGTGAVAAAVAAYLEHDLAPPITIKTQGDCELIVDFTPSDPISEVSLEGKAKLVFKGTIDLSEIGNM
jgi:diaminopimelate epimerase